jgi:hypothetical protein
LHPHLGDHGATDTSTHKKVAVRHRQLGLVPGYIDPDRLPWLRNGTALELLRPEGQAQPLAPGDVHAIYFVDDFARCAELRTLPMPGRAAARLPGVWVRVRWRGQPSLEGLLATNLLQLKRGIELTPLRMDCAWQRVYIPFDAVEELSVVDVVRPPRRRRSASGQIDLFAAGEMREGS